MTKIRLISGVILISLFFSGCSDKSRQIPKKSLCAYISLEEINSKQIFTKKI